METAPVAAAGPGGGRGVVVVLGEAVVDLVDQGGDRYRAHPGGSPLNVAVGLGRLGQPVQLRARISADTFGRMFRGHLTASGVDDRGLVAAAEPSTLAVASLDGAGVASYDFWVAGTADWQWTPAELAAPFGPDVVALHTGSMTLEVEPGATLVLELMRRERAEGLRTVSYDPNVRLARRGPAAPGRRRVAEAVRLADVVKVSADDLAWVWPGEDPREVARRWVGLPSQPPTAGAARGPGNPPAGGELGDPGETGDPAGWRPALVVVTLGADGAYAVTAAGAERYRPARRVPVVDTVGAGDAFMAGLLDGLAGAGALGPGSRAALTALSPTDLGQLLDRAALVAALTCARAGADPPTRAEVTAAPPAC